MLKVALKSWSTVIIVWHDTCASVSGRTF